MRVLLGTGESLEELYAPPRTPWWRVSMVATADGAATGTDGRSGSINNAVDQRVYATLRRLADVVVVGAGTARAEEYGVSARPIVVVSRRGAVPPTLAGLAPGRVLLATTGSAPGLAAARDLLGAEQVLVCGPEAVDLARLRGVLTERGLRRVLCEGGPHLLRDALAAGVVDELATTWVPRLVAGGGPRITAGPPVDVPLDLHTLLEEDGTLLARWLTVGAGPDRADP